MENDAYDVVCDDAKALTIKFHTLADARYARAGLLLKGIPAQQMAIAEGATKRHQKTLDEINSQLFLSIQGMRDATFRPWFYDEIRPTFEQLRAYAKAQMADLPAPILKLRSDGKAAVTFPIPHRRGSYPSLCSTLDDGHQFAQLKKDEITRDATEYEQAMDRGEKIVEKTYYLRLNADPQKDRLGMLRDLLAAADCSLQQLSADDNPARRINPAGRRPTDYGRG